MEAADQKTIRFKILQGKKIHLISLLLSKAPSTLRQFSIRRFLDLESLFKLEKINNNSLKCASLAQKCCQDKWTSTFKYHIYLYFFKIFPNVHVMEKLFTLRVNRLGDLLDLGQLFTAFGTNYFAQISYILKQFL